MKPAVIKLWTGIGAYSLTQGLVWAVPAPEAFSQGMGGQNPACQPVVVSEGGEGGEGAARPRYKPAPANQRLRDPKVLAGIVEGFVNHVVIPNYQALEQSTADLNEAVQVLVRDPKPETLAAAREAFRRSRVIWEESEAFAFGPAATLGLDGALDEWPLDEGEVVAVLPGSGSLTPEKAAELPDGLRGYHAVGFLLFGSQNNKSLADFTPQDYAYLKVVTPVLAKTAQTLRQTWTDGVDAFPAYGKVMTTAGNHRGDLMEKTGGIKHQGSRGEFVGLFSPGGVNRIITPHSGTTKGISSSLNTASSARISLWAARIGSWA